MKEFRISIIGLGKLGAPLAVALAYRGMNVIGVDKREDVVKSLNNKVPHIYEPEFEKLLKLPNINFEATKDFQHAITNTDITMIVVNTPSNDDGSYSLEQVFVAGKNIAEALKLKDDYHLIALTSTVMPGDTIKLKNLIEEISGKVAGKDFGICYNPEFIALGSVIRDFLNPDFVLIGEYDKRSGDILEEMYKLVCLNNPPIMRMNIINAEIAKIALNSYITMKMTFANFLAELCERYEGADVDVITRAIGTDSRIGVKYFKGGPSYGGPCFPRDNRAVALVAERAKVNSSLPKLIDSLNRHYTERIAEIINQNLKENSTVTILGLTYKPNTNIIEESVGVNLSNILLKFGNYNLKLYDPLAKDSLKQVFKDKRVKICEDIHEAIKDTDAIVITVLHKELEELPNMIKDDREILIIDCWRNFKNRFSNKVKYYALGIGKKK